MQNKFKSQDAFRGVLMLCIIAGSILPPTKHHFKVLINSYEAWAKFYKMFKSILTETTCGEKITIHY